MRPVVFWRAARAYSLPASVVPVLLGTVLAARGYGEVITGGHFNLVAFLFALIGGILAQVAANVINDYFDFRYGVDTRPEHGSGVITRGEMTAAQALLYSLVLFAIAAGCGLFLFLRAPDRAVIYLAAIGFGCAVLYSAWLKKYGLGDLLIILTFGFGLTLGAYVVQVHAVGWRQIFFIMFYSLPICLLVDGILHANNMRDFSDDQSARVRTMATMLGRSGARILLLLLLFGPIALVLFGVATRLLPLWSLVTLLALPLLVRAARTGSVEGTAQAHLLFGLLYTAAFLLKPVYW